MENKHFKDNGERFYETPYGNIPSVTTILSLYDGGKSGALMGWSVKVMAEYLQTLADKDGNILIKKEEAFELFKKAKARHKQLKEEAADLGSEAHNLIEVYIKGQSVEGLLAANLLLAKPFNAFKTWQATHNFEFIASERQVCSYLLFGGTLDAIAKKDGKLWVIDFKTSNRINEDYLWQIAAYKECAERGKYYDGEMGWVDSNYEIDGGVGILRLDKLTGEPEWKEYTLLEATDGFECFMALCHLWHSRKKDA